MNNEQLQQLTEAISQQYFHKPFKHKAVFNPRLRTTGGRYLLHTHHIEINKKYYDTFGIEEVIGIIKHELCHYHLHLEGKGYQHRDPEFKALLKKVGAPRFCSPLSPISANKGKSTYKYICTHCQKKYERRRKVNINRFVCGSCKGTLKLLPAIDQNESQK
ncbi:SprT family protein [Bacillus chungangensis]|uniref:Protein SprT-like n=1 Tax=Bacillus chungangensis TaxID=587633 RepID=A0ABT9WY16_9BACI|nr:SprT family protein [Bacillus chungangensis]MDQ0178115.1 SprT-like protein [Bacillus chungangensis]